MFLFRNFKKRVVFLQHLCKDLCGPHWCCACIGSATFSLPLLAFGLFPDCTKCNGGGLSLTGGPTPPPKASNILLGDLVRYCQQAASFEKKQSLLRKRPFHDHQDLTTHEEASGLQIRFFLQLLIQSFNVSTLFFPGCVSKHGLHSPRIAWILNLIESDDLYKHIITLIFNIHIQIWQSRCSFLYTCPNDQPFVFFQGSILKNSKAEVEGWIISQFFDLGCR